MVVLDMEGTQLKGYYSIRQAAENLAISRQHVHKLIKSGELRAFYVDNYYLISTEEIRRFKSSRSLLETDNRYKIK